MELVIKSRNGKMTERQRGYIEEKLTKLDRFLDKDSKVTIEIASENHRSQGEVFRAQATLVADHGILVRAEEQASDLFRAIDDVQNKLQRQLTRYKDRHWKRGKVRRDESFVSEPVAVTADDEDAIPQLVRTKEFALKPMFVDDAVEQMELLGHTFFVFRDAETERTSVVYRRTDGNYGLISPTNG